MIKDLVRRLFDVHARRFRRPPALRSGKGGTPTVYYLCPDDPDPSGGTRVIYRHVDILNGAGINAAVLHHKTGFACRWFEHSTRVVGAPTVTVTERDVLVIPEIYGPSLASLPRVPRMVIFSQNAYLTFDGLGEEVSSPYRDLPSLKHLLTVSEDSANYLRFAFPELPVTVVLNGVDPAVFHPSDKPSAQRVAIMPRKRIRDAEQVLNLLRSHGSLQGWEVVTIADRTERETAALLRSCPVFLAFGKQEGFGLPAAEAMASGCYVVGFTGFGGREFFFPEFSSPVEDGDVLAFARKSAAVLQRYEQDPEAVRREGMLAAAYIARTYGIERVRGELLSFYAKLGTTN